MREASDKGCAAHIAPSLYSECTEFSGGGRIFNLSHYWEVTSEHPRWGRGLLPWVRRTLLHSRPVSGLNAVNSTTSSNSIQNRSFPRRSSEPIYRLNTEDNKSNRKTIFAKNTKKTYRISTKQTRHSWLLQLMTWKSLATVAAKLPKLDIEQVKHEISSQMTTKRQPWTVSKEHKNIIKNNNN